MQVLELPRRYLELLVTPLSLSESLSLRTLSNNMTARSYHKVNFHVN